MAIDTTTVRSRRTLLGATVGALAALGAQAIGRPLRVRASNDDPVLVGHAYNATSATGLINDTTAGSVLGAETKWTGAGASAALFGKADGGDGLFAYSKTGNGVYAQGDAGHAVHATSQGGVGVFAHSGISYAIDAASDSVSSPAARVRSPDLTTAILASCGDTTGSHPGVNAEVAVHGIAMHSASTTRAFYGEVTAGTGVDAVATTGIGVHGKSTSGRGVHAESTSGEGMHGESSDNNGVSGSSASGIASGVFGQNTSTGYGVAGTCHGGIGVSGFSNEGVAVNASSASGLAIQAQGRVKFSTAGLTAIGVDTSSKTITPGVDLVASSKILCTLESSQAKLFIQRVVKNVAADTFTVYLSASVASGKSAKVAWFVIG